MCVMLKILWNDHPLFLWMGENCMDLTTTILFDQIGMRTSDLQKCLFHKKTPKKILQIYLCMDQCWMIINLQSPIFVELMSQQLLTWILCFLDHSKQHLMSFASTCYLRHMNNSWITISFVGDCSHFKDLQIDIFIIFVFCQQKNF